MHASSSSRHRATHPPPRHRSRLPRRKRRPPKRHPRPKRLPSPRRKQRNQPKKRRLPSRPRNQLTPKRRLSKLAAVDTVFEQLGSMTVLELVELKNKIEEEWGITA